MFIIFSRYNLNYDSVWTGKVLRPCKSLEQYGRAGLKMGCWLLSRHVTYDTFFPSLCVAACPQPFSHSSSLTRLYLGWQPKLSQSAENGVKRSEIAFGFDVHITLQSSSKLRQWNVAPYVRKGNTISIKQLCVLAHDTFYFIGLRHILSISKYCNLADYSQYIHAEFFCSIFNVYRLLHDKFSQRTFHQNLIFLCIHAQTKRTLLNKKINIYNLLYSRKIKIRTILKQMKTV